MKARWRSVLWVGCARSSGGGGSGGGSRVLSPAAGDARMAGAEETRVKQLGEVPGPQSCAGNLSGRSLLLQPGHFKQRWRQTARGCTPGSEPPWSRRCADLRRRQVSKKCPSGPSP
ncbi:potassium voltage-gated channel subfamily KQT member 3-like [Bos indicus]|uniref:Potassium voltage-gated channel subfamily KQT member 3-like n=1 Tax=Bos indicus TaxID=9915 RepID=A0ABM4SAW4_BOSIN|nr:potassium voltage-gated channel subfamily KQT member 3-like [Bos indicus x Bos taurus]XP_027399151.1 potassium voltage-gated channel subfamily KQT member 3-like [Bos indicus x Bos taurus]